MFESGRYGQASRCTMSVAPICVFFFFLILKLPFRSLLCDSQQCRAALKRIKSACAFWPVLSPKLHVNKSFDIEFAIKFRFRSKYRQGCITVQRMQHIFLPPITATSAEHVTSMCKSKELHLFSWTLLQDPPAGLRLFLGCAAALQSRRCSSQ